MAIAKVSSTEHPRQGHWLVTVRDENGVLDPDGVDTGPTYSAKVAEGGTWADIERQLVPQIQAGRARVANDTVLAGRVDLASLEAML